MRTSGFSGLAPGVSGKGPAFASVSLTASNASMSSSALPQERRTITRGIGSNGLGAISMAVVCVGTPWLKAKACRCASFSGGVRRRRPFSECQNTPCAGEIGCANGSEISVLSFQLSEISCAKVETSMSSGTDKTGGGAILFRASSIGGTGFFSIGYVFRTK